MLHRRHYFGLPDFSKVKIRNATRKNGDKDFISMFRSMSPYINVHRNTSMVIHLPGELLVEGNQFESTMQDIALCSSFGIRLVLVTGSRPQVAKRLMAKNIPNVYQNKIRITNVECLESVIDAAGNVRAQVESCLGKGLTNAPGWHDELTVTSGNFVVAQPVGVHFGIDYKYSGTVRKVNTGKINRALDHGDIVVISNLGYSSSGEVFNCVSEQVATKCAMELKAAKLIFLHNGQKMMNGETQQNIHSISLSDAQRLVAWANDAKVDGCMDWLDYLDNAILACKAGVKRVHLVNRHEKGGLLEELFTRDGSGTMICRDIYEGVRTAKPKDIDGIRRILQPLLESDVLVSRSHDHVELNIQQFSILERDGAILSCAQLVKYENGMAELACLAVDPTYRSSGKGNAILAFVLRKARHLNIQKVFVLTTKTSHWFMERGFKMASLHDLPIQKQNATDPHRNSKVYMLDISHERALDEQELLMDL